jgi:hypothetical protein
MRRFLWLLLCVSVSTSLFAQKGGKRKAADEFKNTDSLLFSRVKYRLVGPFRGGRSAAVTGSYKNKNTFYFGATGGGVWKTTDGGSNWRNVSTNISAAPSAPWLLHPAMKTSFMWAKARTPFAAT